MFIAILEFEVAEADRTRALDALTREPEEVRTMSGNIAFRPFLDPESAGQVVLLHEWENQPSFRAYTDSPSFARLGAALRPLMTKAPLSRRFHAELAQVVA